MAKSAESLRAERDRFVAFSFAAADLLLELDEAFRIVYASGAARQLLGCEAAEIVGQALIDLIDRQDRRLIELLLGRLAESRRLEPTAVKLAAGPLAVLGACHLPDAGRRYHATLTATKLAGSNSRLSADRDPDSGALGRHAFGTLMGELVGGVHRLGLRAELTLLQMAGLGELRQRLGDGAVNEILGEVGSLLRARSLTGDAVGRLAPDKYGIVHGDDVDGGAFEREIAQISRRADPAGDGIRLRRHSIPLEPGAMTEQDATRVLVYTINKFAESEGDGFNIAALSDGLDAMVEETASRVTALKKILQSNAFKIVFQPIVRLDDRSVHHYEVLSRFPRGLPPLETVTFAEQVGLIEELDLAVCRQAIRFLTERSWMAEPIALAVNISGRSLGSAGFVSALRELLAKLGKQRRSILLEITETSRLADLAAADRVLRQLRADGHAICLDDFGAGASSLQYLQALTVDYVKIDGSYVRQVLANGREAAILKAMVSLCRDLEVSTVAEMIEEEVQAERLAALGVEYGQGWLFGRPGAVIEAAAQPALAAGALRQRA